MKIEQNLLVGYKYDLYIPPPIQIRVRWFMMQRLSSYKKQSHIC